MKKTIIKILALVGAVSVGFGLLSGCGRVKNEIQEEVAEKKAEVQEIGQEIKGDGAAAVVEITEEEAKEIALKEAGLTAEEVIFTEISLDREDGRREYEIEFRKDRTEYSVEISAVDGTILSWEVDVD